jgi:hypothetical protein
LVVSVGVTVYRGPAVVVLPNGSWFAAVASLEPAGLPGNEAWRGTVTSDDRSALWDVMTAGRATLRVSVGWAGEFASPRLEGTDGRTLRVMGYGPGPF